MRQVAVSQIGEEKDGHVTMAVAVRTQLFGTLRGRMALPVTRVGERVGVRWRPYLRLPGLRPGERVKPHDPRDAAPRLGAGRRRAAPGSRADRGGDRRASRRRATTRAPASSAPTTTGSPAGRARCCCSATAASPPTKSRRGRSVRATIRPGLQRAAVSALGDKLGGVAVLRPRDGAVLALSGLATTGPQPPGSTFKIITLSAALQTKKASVSSVYPVRTFATLSGVKLRNASDESCGGSLTQSFAHSCNSVFAPLGAEVGRKRMVAAAERFGFNVKPRVPDAVTSQFPRDLKDDLAVGAASIGQERDLATPLQMAAVGATIANRGVHPSPRIVRSDKVVRKRAVSRTTAAQVREMMLAVVRGGTGTAAALPGVEVAGKTGTAELRPTAGGPAGPEEHRRVVRRLRPRAVAEGRRRGHARRRRPGRRDRRADRARSAQRRALGAREAAERALGADALEVLAPDAVVGDLLLGAQRRLDRAALGLELGVGDRLLDRGA